MHKGRTYPFHPTFWSTEGWFWPGFVPWKLLGCATPPFNGAWNNIPIGWTGLSFEGQPSDDRTSILYQFIVKPGVPVYRLWVIMELEDVGHVKRCKWTVLLRRATLNIQSAECRQEFPQRQVLTSLADEWCSVEGYPSDPPPLFTFQPANYGQGGDPWPPPHP